MLLFILLWLLIGNDVGAVLGCGQRWKCEKIFVAVHVNEWSGAGSMTTSLSLFLQLHSGSSLMFKLNVHFCGLQTPFVVKPVWHSEGSEGWMGFYLSMPDMFNRVDD